MKIGIPNHTHANVQGVRFATIAKLLGEDESSDGWADADCVLHRDGDMWRNRGSGGGITIDQTKIPDVLGEGDVIRLRPDSSLVHVLWRRGARSNSLFATERCNSLCLMCSQPPRDVDDRWRVEEMLRTVPLIDKTEAHLGITGGEPTLLGHGLAQVLAACNEQLPETRLHVLTNGRLFKNAGDAEAWINAGGTNTTWAVPLYADVPRIHDEVVAAPGAFDETLDGLYELARNGANVEIRVVLHAITIPRLRQLAAFIYRRLPFVRHVALMGLEPIGFAKGNRDKLWIDPADYLAELSDAVAFLANRKMTVSIYNLPLCILPKPLWPFARQSISEWKNKFPDPCTECVVLAHCAGFFASAGEAWRSRNIRAFQLEDLSNELA